LIKVSQLLEKDSLSWCWLISNKNLSVAFIQIRINDTNFWRESELRDFCRYTTNFYLKLKVTANN